MDRILGRAMRHWSIPARLIALVALVALPLLGMYLHERDRAQEVQRRGEGVALVITLLLGVALATVFARRITATLAAVSAGAHALAEGRYDTRLPVGEGGELGALVTDFNALAARLERTAMERAASEQRYRLALSAGRLVAWEWAADAERIVWGKGDELVRGPLPEGVREYPDFRDMVHPGDREHYLACGRRAVAGKESYLAEFRIVWLDGSVHWIKSQGVVQAGTWGRADRLFGVAQDITERVAAGEALRESHAALERRVQERTEALRAANAELEAFSYSVAHDLRSPLRAIDGFSRVLEEELSGGLAPEAARLLARIRGNAAMMGTMIDALLDFSRIGRSELDLREVDLQALARDVCEEMLAGHPRARVEIGTLPPVRADRTLIRVVLANLVGNALKFSSRAEVPQVTISATARDDRIEVVVADNGVGFDAQYGAKLFGVFQRLHSQNEFEGTGIGLATVARIVNRHGGEVRADSRCGSGATFRFTLPAAAGQAGERTLA